MTAPNTDGATDGATDGTCASLRIAASLRSQKFAFLQWQRLGSTDELVAAVQ
jgi:hypothetical protein